MKIFDDPKALYHQPGETWKSAICLHRMTLIILNPRMIRATRSPTPDLKLHRALLQRSGAVLERTVMRSLCVFRFLNIFQGPNSVANMTLDTSRTSTRGFSNTQLAVCVVVSAMVHNCVAMPQASLSSLSEALKTITNEEISG